MESITRRSRPWMLQTEEYRRPIQLHTSPNAVRSLVIFCMPPPSRKAMLALPEFCAKHSCRPSYHERKPAGRPSRASGWCSGRGSLGHSPCRPERHRHELRCRPSRQKPSWR
eukprot:1272019-Prymnesium_polylepis.1